MHKEETVIQVIVRYSNEILTLKLLREQLQRAETIKNLTTLRLYECNKSLPEMIKEIDSRIIMLKLDIKRMLSLIIGEKKMYIVPTKLSTEELNTGYVLFAEADDKGKLLLVEDKPIEWILPLSDFKDSVRVIQAGTLIPKKDNESVLGNFNSVIKETITKYNNVIKKRVK